MSYMSSRLRAAAPRAHRGMAISVSIDIWRRGKTPGRWTRRAPPPTLPHTRLWARTRTRLSLPTTRDTPPLAERYAFFSGDPRVLRAPSQWSCVRPRQQHGWSCSEYGVASILQVNGLLSRMKQRIITTGRHRMLFTNLTVILPINKRKEGEENCTAQEEIPLEAGVGLLLQVNGLLSRMKQRIITTGRHRMLFTNSTRFS